MRALALAPALLLVACEAPSTGPEIFVVQTLSLLGEGDGGVSMGWNLDGVVTDENEPSGCYVTDLTHPDGTPGIDNAFGGLYNALQATEGAAIPALVQASVDSGELLLVMEVDERDDGCVDFSVVRGAGAPAIGGHGKILPGQTYDVNTEAPGFAGECAADDNGNVVRVDGFNLGLPLSIFDESLFLTILDGKVEVHRRDDGSYRGILAGGVSTAEIRANMADMDGIGDDIPVIVETAMDQRADLVPDANGFCSRISVALTFEAVTAFLFEE